MKNFKPLLKHAAGFLVLIALLALTACGEQQQAPTAEVKQETKEAIVWKLAMTWPTNFPIFGDAVDFHWIGETFRAADFLEDPLGRTGGKFRMNMQIDSNFWNGHSFTLHF